MPILLNPLIKTNGSCCSSKRIITASLRKVLSWRIWIFVYQGKSKTYFSKCTNANWNLTKTYSKINLYEYYQYILEQYIRGITQLNLTLKIFRHKQVHLINSFEFKRLVPIENLSSMPKHQALQRLNPQIPWRRLGINVGKIGSI